MSSGKSLKRQEVTGMRGPSPRKILKLAKTISEYQDSFSHENSFFELGKSVPQKV
jgi:hypothetical protein